jgi:hypothetical protein
MDGTIAKNVGWQCSSGFMYSRMQYFAIVRINEDTYDHMIKLFSGKSLDGQQPVQPEWELYLDDTAKVLLRNLNANGYLLFSEYLETKFFSEFCKSANVCTN